MKNKLNKFITAISVAIFTFSIPLLVSAETIQESKLFTGAQKMLSDASGALMIITPVIGALLFGIFALIQGLSNEQHDKEKWAKNKKAVLISVILVFTATSVIAVISGYFK